jgi:hypothetical protein
MKKPIAKAMGFFFFTEFPFSTQFTAPAKSRAPFFYSPIFQNLLTNLSIGDRL